MTGAGDRAAVRIGKRITRARGDRNMTELAELVGITSQTWSRWESGLFSPEADRQVAVADALGVEWDWLFDPRYDEDKNGHDDGGES